LSLVFSSKEVSLNRSFLFVGMAALAVLLCAGGASAQTPATVTVVSGNGQLICQNCVGVNAFFFTPLVVRVTDANGQPVGLAPVQWDIPSGANNGSLAGGQTTTYTDANGYTSNSFFPNSAAPASFQNIALPVVITATAGTASATFNLTLGQQLDSSFTGGFFQNPFVFRVLQDSAGLTGGSSYTGQIGTTSTTPIKVQLVTLQTGAAIPNIAVRLVNMLPNTSTIQCAAEAGAGVDTVLTDASGIATCRPIFGGVPNVQGNAYLSVGGGYPLEHFTFDPTIPPTSFYQFPFPGVGALVVRATPALPGALRLLSGSGQSAQSGQSFGVPLKVQLVSTNGAGLADQTIQWTLSPAGSGSLGTATTITDANGQTTNNVTLGRNANGPITVTAKLQGSTLPAVTFNLTAVPAITLTGLTTLSGNNQSAVVNTAFGAPLIVQLNASNGPASGAPVTFTISGPGILSSNSVITGSNGQAQVTVQASGTAGNISVVASAGGFSQTFNLVVSPPGPSLTASSFMNAADFQRGALSPCSLATIVAPGLAPGLQGMISGSLFGVLPYQVANDTVSVGGAAAPIFAVGLNIATNQQQLTFQVPCDVTPGSSVPVTVNVGAGNATINIAIQPASPGVFQTVMTDGVSRAVLVRPDGSFVSLTNPARRGENLVAFATGLGQATSPVGSNSVAAPGAVVSPKGTVVVGMAGRGLPLISAQLSDELLGVWLVTFTVPTDVPQGNNVTFSISVIPAGSGSPIASGGTSVPVQ
jgi:uncharacterized protein (TIGR03437 family)